MGVHVTLLAELIGLDTSVVIEITSIDEDALPQRSSIAALTLTKFASGSLSISDPAEQAERLERLIDHRATTRTSGGTPPGRCPGRQGSLQSEQFASNELCPDKASELVRFMIAATGFALIVHDR